MTIERKQAPSLGRIVLVRGELIDPTDCNVELPGIITKVWGNDNLSIQVFGSDTANLLVGVKYEDDLAVIKAASWRWPPFVAPKANDEKGDPAAPGELTFLDRLRIELLELTERRQKLGIFFGSEIFRTLSAENKTLLDQQQVVMDHYIRILDRRIALAEKA